MEKLIPFFVFICKCPECTGDNDVEMEDLEEKEKVKRYQKIAQESLKLRDSDFSEDAILQRAKQILFQRGGADAKLVMNKLIESPNDLSSLIEVVNRPSNPIVNDSKRLSR